MERRLSYDSGLDQGLNLAVRVLFDHLAQDAHGVGFDSFRKLDELDYVKPALAELNFRNVGLGPLEPLGHIRLPQPSSFAGFDQDRAQMLVGW
jgi:hypothetical protein